MSFYDEQIKQRIKNDDDAFSDAFTNMANIVMGSKLSHALEDAQIHTKTAMEAIFKYYHVKAPEVPESIKDVNEQIDYMLRPTGIMKRVVNLEGAWWDNSIGAFLAIRKDDGTSVALLPHKLWGYVFFDEKKQKNLRITKKTAQLFETEALCFYKPFPMRKLSTKDMFLFSLSTLSRSDLIGFELFTLISVGLGFFTPKLNNIIYGTIIVDDNMRLLLSVFTCMFFVNMTQMLINILKSLFMDRITVRLNTAVEAASMMRLLSLPSNFFRKYSSGELSSRESQVSTLCSSLLNTVLSTGFTSVLSLSYIGQMMYYAPGLVVPGLIVIIVTVLFSTFSVFMQMKISLHAMEYASQESGITFALISGVQKIKLAGAEKRAFAKWAQAYSKNAKLAYDPPAVVKLNSIISTSISLIGTIVIYFFTIKTGVKLADYYSFNASYGMVMGAFSSLIGMATTFSTLKPTYEMVRPILETVPETSEQKKQATKLSGAIELSHITFRYNEQQKNVIEDLSLKIKSGQYVAIVGKTGCGKSTLMRLLLGFELPQKGAVYYDGKDLNTLDVKSVRRKIGTVIQDGQLFLGDIYSNIVIAAPQLTQEEAWEAAEIAGIAEDIHNMPMGMHTVISEGSGGISGGQKQRLMIARAVAPKPKILMLDEATSALDNITQKKISESLDTLKCTRIVIAHRLSTIKHCDRILVLDDGKVVEDGTYDELIAQKGFFAELVERQRVDV